MRGMSKEEAWQEARAKTEQITDRLGMKVDPMVVDTVTAMRLHGFDTRVSCEGHLDRITSGPFVKFVSPIAVERFKEAKELQERGQPADGQVKKKMDEGRLETWREMRRMYDLIEDFKRAAVYESRELLVVRYVMNEHIFLQCYGVEFIHLYTSRRKQEMLLEYQGVMRAFAQYLKDVLRSE